MDERKFEILRAIINDYISNGEPVGSRSIVKKTNIGLSSATIRNEMADLEEMGYLEQPHTSAGRIPSDKAYRLYVDEMLSIEDIDDDSITMLSEIVESKIDELSYMLQRAAKLLSKITGYPVVVTAPSTPKDIIKKIHIFILEDGKAMIVVTTEEGSVHNSVIKIPENLTEMQIRKIADILTARLHGMTIANIDIKLASEMQNFDGIPADAIIPVLHGIIECIERIDDKITYSGGVSNILEMPEFSDQSRAKELISMIEDKNTMTDMIGEMDGDELVISIGSENDNDKMKDCTIVTSNYDIDNKHRMVIGIIGPKRMDYSKVVSVLKDMGKILNLRIKNVLQEPKNKDKEAGGKNERKEKEE